MRLLLIAEWAEYRLLLRKHVEIEWPNSIIVEHRLGDDNLLDAQFAATAFDAVIIAGVASEAGPATAVPSATNVVSATVAGAAERLAVELASKPEFAPVILLTFKDAPASASAPLAGLQRLYGRKIDREGLIQAITAASRDQRRSITRLRTQPEFANRYRFGSVVIRGHRRIRQIGSGGMCTIYLAESERAGTLVVLKVFSQVPDVSEGNVSFDRFLQEYEIVAGLKHQNIVRIYDLGVADDHAYIAMEHFSAGDLRQRMKTPLLPSIAVTYLTQIASALEAIHAVGVLHRDLKPANVMLRADGSLCLIDFGLAKANDFDLSLTGSREIFGTPYYMSPEQGHAEDIDARSDLYSLGVMFYEMLIGRKPYLGATAMEVIYKHKRADLPEIAPEFASYEELLRRLLAKAPANRYQSARDLLEAIAALKIPA